MTLIDFESVKRLNASLTHIPIRTMWGMQRSEKADPKDDDFRANILCQMMNDKKWHYWVFAKPAKKIVASDLGNESE